MTLKEIHNTQYVACMNPTSGSFSINPRLQVCFQVELHLFVFSDAGSKEAFCNSTIYFSVQIASPVLTVYKPQCRFKLIHPNFHLQKLFKPQKNKLVNYTCLQRKRVACCNYKSIRKTDVISSVWF